MPQSIRYIAPQIFLEYSFDEPLAAKCKALFYILVLFYLVHYIDCSFKLFVQIVQIVQYNNLK